MQDNGGKLLHFRCYWNIRKIGCCTLLFFRIFRARQLRIMKVLVHTQGYLKLVANPWTTNQARIYMNSTCKVRQIWVISWSFLLSSLLHAVLVNAELVPLQSQYASILLDPNILKNHADLIFDYTT